MTISLQVTQPVQARVLGLRDANGSAANASSDPGFDDVLNGLGGQTGATPSPLALGNAPSTRAGTAGVGQPSTSAPTAPQSLQVLFDQTSLATESSEGTHSGKGRATKDDDPAPAGVRGRLDDSVDATTAASAAAQTVSLATGTLAMATSTTSLPATAAVVGVLAAVLPAIASPPDTAMTADKAKVTTRDSTDAASPELLDGAATMMSSVKVETHLATTTAVASGPLRDVAEAPDHDATSGDTSSGTMPAIHAEPAATAATLAPSPRTNPDSAPATLVVPATMPPIQAISNVVSSTLKSSAPAAIIDSASAPATSTSPPRALTLQLTPASLGTINVTMRLVGHSLDLRLVASDQDTLATLNRDRSDLSKAVQDQGYDLNSLVVQGTESASSSSWTGDTSRDQGNSPAGGQSSQSDPGTGGDASGRRMSRSQGNSSDDTSRPLGGSGAGALFV